MKGNRKEAATAFTWQSTRFNADDFAAGEHEGSTIAAGSTPKEFLEAEIGDDNGVDSQFSSYRRFRPGGETDPRGQSGVGKWYVKLQGDQDGDGTVEAVDPRTQIRMVKRPQNGDDRTPLTGWYTVRDLGRDDPRQRIPLPPARDDDGDPLVVQEGDVVAFEARNPATDVVISRADSTVEGPSQVGY